MVHVKSTRPRPPNNLQWLDLKIEHQERSASVIHQGDTLHVDIPSHPVYKQWSKDSIRWLEVHYMSRIVIMTTLL